MSRILALAYRIGIPDNILHLVGWPCIPASLHIRAEHTRSRADGICTTHMGRQSEWDRRHEKRHCPQRKLGVMGKITSFSSS